ncbi:hypothetical protein QF046_001433 [Microbacterium sp. W4I4]|uniref:hypothetical protein n=1 Tax=Microbacterium sp. W4I4 TaxID=3042295 RepID=UPI00278A38B4|nr:hypothetical protein [Microbacterium sp. W4I4]MDQ0613792.1 hypothetical protein [Microbacterium sp. W4I4]
MNRKRIAFAVLSNSAASVATFSLSVSVARNSTIDGFGAFSLAMIIFLFGSGLQRAGLTDSALSRPASKGAFVRNSQRGSVVGVLGGISLAVIGTLSANTYLIFLGIAFHGLLALDFLRTYDAAVGNVTRAFMTTILWSATTISFAVVSIVSPIPSPVVFGSWAFCGATIGYISALIARMPLVPRWPKNRFESRIAGLFGLDYIVGSGGSSLTTALLGTFVSPQVIAAIRGGGTLLGPVNLISATVRSLSLPFLAAGERRISEFAKAVRLTLAVSVVITPLLGFLVFLPDTWGAELLGESWTVARPALLPLSIETLLALVGGIAAAGHRVAFASVRTLVLRLSVGIPRPFIVVCCAVAWGIPGAAWSMAIIAAVNAVLWWTSYRLLTRPA